MGCFAHSQRFSCPEITDEVCSVVADKEVIAVAYMSELQRIKGISIFSKKTGIEISNIQVRYFKLYSSTMSEIMTVLQISSVLKDSIVFPSFSLTHFHVVVVRLSQRIDKNIASLKVAIYSKTSGKMVNLKKIILGIIVWLINSRMSCLLIPNGLWIQFKKRNCESRF